MPRGKVKLEVGEEGHRECYFSWFGQEKNWVDILPVTWMKWGRKLLKVSEKKAFKAEEKATKALETGMGFVYSGIPRATM